MTRAAAEQLVGEREGRLCVQFLRRADGTVLTADCENAWKRAVRRAGSLAATAAGVVLAAALTPLAVSAGASRGAAVGPTAFNRLSSTCQHLLGINQELGGVRAPAAPPAVTQVLGDFVAPATRPTTAPATTQPQLIRGEMSLPVATQPTTAPAAAVE
jgi:hypothetical protein